MNDDGRQRQPRGNTSQQQTPVALDYISKTGMPHNIDAELAVIGSVLINNDNWVSVSEIVQPEDFYDERHKVIWQAMSRLFDKKRSVIDEITLIDELSNMGELERIGGAGYVSDIPRYAVSASHAVQYARIVHEKAMLRRLILAGIEIANSGASPEVDFEEQIVRAEELIYNISIDRPKRTYTQLGVAAKQMLEEIKQNQTNTEPYTGIPSGFPLLDYITGGFQPSDLIILAARPAMGKTSFALNIARNAAEYLGAKGEGSVVVFSLEMPAKQLAARIIASEALISVSKMRTHRHNLDSKEWTRLADTVGKLYSLPLLIDDTSSLNVEVIRSRCRKLKMDSDIRMIIIDYLQMMDAPSNTKRDGRERQIAETTRGLKLLAKELDVPIIALSQLNRDLEKRQDKRPTLSDLRESGAIEQDADLIMFLYREAQYKDKETLTEEERSQAELIIAKHRNGPTGKIPLKFEEEFTRFFQVDNEEFIQ